MSEKKQVVLELYERLFEAFGPLHWWPAESRFEVIMGAVLTQNTAWRNVEKGIAALKARDLLSPEAMYNIPLNKLAALIRPCGYYNIKAERLKSFVMFLYKGYEGDLDKLLGIELITLRKELLSVKGIGPETADSIILYAAQKPSFVVDAYTQRVLYRHHLIPNDVSYDMIQNFFMDRLPRDVQLYNEYHALLVHLGKSFCSKTRPKCVQCPLEGFNQ
jgi:endonuclease-3 related protein